MNDEMILDYQSKISSFEFSAFLQILSQYHSDCDNDDDLNLWLASAAGQEFLSREEGKEWINSRDGMKWSRSVENTFIQMNLSYFLGEEDKRRREMLMRIWMCEKDGQIWLTGKKGQEWLRSDEGLKILNEPIGLIFQEIIKNSEKKHREAEIKKQAKILEKRMFGLYDGMNEEMMHLQELLKYRISKLRENVYKNFNLKDELNNLLWLTQKDGISWLNNTKEGRKWIDDNLEKLETERNEDMYFNRIFYITQMEKKIISDDDFESWKNTVSGKLFLNKYTSEINKIKSIIENLNMLSNNYNEDNIQKFFDNLEKIRNDFENISPKCYIASLKLRDFLLMQKYYYLFIPGQSKPDINKCINKIKSVISNVCNRYLLIKTTL